MARKGGDFQPGDRLHFTCGGEGKVIGLHGKGRSRKVYYHDLGEKDNQTRAVYIRDLKRMLVFAADRYNRPVFVAEDQSHG